MATCRYLTLGTNNVIVFTWNKFVFCPRELEFMGYWLGNDGVRPTLGMLESISKFSRPTDISGVRNYFGLLEQVSWAFTETKAMEPF
jgi:hypothetical protein